MTEVARREFAMPDVGEGLTEAEIVTWQVQPGDQVTVNQVICEIETAKAAVELPCPYAGTVGELLAQPGETIAVGTPIIMIETAEAAPAEERGAKIGEAGADGRIATLVGYGPRPARSPVAPAARRQRRLSRLRRRRPSGRRRNRLRNRLLNRRSRRPRRRRATGPSVAPSRWPSRRCASWPRTSVSTCTRSGAPAKAA